MNISIDDLEGDNLFEDEDIEFVLNRISRMMKDKIFDLVFFNFCMIVKHIPFNKMWSWSSYSVCAFDKFCIGAPKFSY
jgi:hypothetical protein